MSHQIHTYTELRQRFTTTCGSNIPNGSSQMGSPPICDSYEACLTEMLDTLTRRGSNKSIVAPHRALAHSNKQ